MTSFIPLLIVTSLYEVFIEVMEYDNSFHISAHCDLTVWSISWGDGVRWHLSHLFSLWPHCMKYLLRGWNLMTFFIPLHIVTSLYEVCIEVMEYDNTLHTSALFDLTVWSLCWRDGVWWHLSYFCSLWPHCMKYLLRWWSMITPFISLLIVTSQYEVFVEGMEYDNTFHTFSHCDLTVWSIYWVDGVRWHLSYLCSLWPHCMKYLLRGWSMMTPFTPFLIVTSLTEVFIEEMEYDDTFHTFLSLWPYCMNYLLRGRSTMTPFIPVPIVTSLYEVFIEGMEYGDTFHTFFYCDLTDWSIYWGDGVQWHLSHLCFWPHCVKYLLRGWSTMIPFIHFFIVTSLYEVFIEGMEYDDTFHTLSHCDLIDWSIYWGDGVQWHLSHLWFWPHCVKYLLRGWSTMTPFIHFLIVTSLTEVFIKGMEYDDTLHTFFSLWPHCMKYVLSGWSTMTSFTSLLLTSLYEVIIERMEYKDIFHISAFDLIVWSIYWEDGVRWYLSYIFSLWPHCMKYLLRGRRTTILFIPFLIATPLYEVFIESIEYDDTYHTFSYCDLTVWSISWGDGVWWHLSYLFSLWPHCMKYLLRGWSTMILFIPFLIVTSLYEVCIEWIEYDDTFNTFSYCDLTVWSIYWGDGVWWHLSYLFSLWPHCMKYLLRGWSLMTFFIPLLIVTSLYEVSIEVM